MEKLKTNKCKVNLCLPREILGAEKLISKRVFIIVVYTDLFLDLKTFKKYINKRGFSFEERVIRCLLHYQ